MQTEDIRQLAQWLAATDIDFLALHGPGVAVEIRRDGTAPDMAAAPTLQAVPSAADRMALCAPSPGVLRDRLPGRATPLCPAGAAVSAGDLMALLQVGPLLLPVRAPCDGWAGDWLVPPGRTVGYGTVLSNIDIDIKTAANAAA